MSSNEKEYLVHTLLQINHSLETNTTLPPEFYTTLRSKIKSYVDCIEYDPTEEVYTSYTHEQRKQVVIISLIVKRLYNIQNYNHLILLITMKTFCIRVLELLDGLDLANRMLNLSLT